MKHSCFLFFLFYSFSAHAQHEKNFPRKLIPLNQEWFFTKDNIKLTEHINWQPINLPHTWNLDDVMDDEPGYYRAACWYKRIFVANTDLANKDVFIFFEGANQHTEVFINGKKAGEHLGGYTSFYVPISGFLKYNEANEILIKVNNSFDQNIPALTADFTFYGGIYRNVSLLAVNRIHFSCNDHGANGVYVSTSVVSKQKAQLTVKEIIDNSGKEAQSIQINTNVFDEQGTIVGTMDTKALAKAGKENLFVQEMPEIRQPHLWSPENAYLYKVVTTIRNRATKAIMDELQTAIGLRFFHFDADSGFYLNGKPYKLMGASRHQDYQGMGNALPKSFAERDIHLLKNMGANFIRVAHYPQDQALLDACDREGVLASVEIPVVNEITESDSFYNNCRNMQLEMIRQNYNHPSVIIWGYMNEILLKPHYKDDKVKQQLYYSHVAQLARSLDSLTRKDDPYRYTMMANHGDFGMYQKAGLVTIPMLVGWNLYMGWYGTTMTDLPGFLDRYHEAFPHQPMLVTEYGADADPRIHSLAPVRFDKSIEYASIFHQYYYSEIMKRSFISGGAIWNLADFNSETRQETMPHVNNKGLLTWQRAPKESYYFYQSRLSKKPFLKITSALWNKRAAVADSGQHTVRQPLKVASNMNKVELYVNGKSLGTKPVENGFAEWMPSFTNGANKIRATASFGDINLTDTATITFLLEPLDFKSNSQAFKNINVLLGANRFFTSADGTPWLPDQLYHRGGWGHTGGQPFKMKNSSRTPLGTDKNITGTDDDPVYQTQQTGIERYNLDVPKGNYTLTLHFAELSGAVAANLAYNLNGSTASSLASERIFDVEVNGNTVLKNFNIAGQYGVARALDKKIIVEVNDDHGIEIRFKAIAGEPVLNALQLTKID